MPADPPAQLRPLLVRAKDLPALLSMSMRKIRSLIAAGRFPQPVRMGSRSVLWRMADIEAWIVENFTSQNGGGR